MSIFESTKAKIIGITVVFLVFFIGFGFVTMKKREENMKADLANEAVNNENIEVVKREEKDKRVIYKLYAKKELQDYEAKAIISELYNYESENKVTNVKAYIFDNKDDASKDIDVTKLVSELSISQEKDKDGKSKKYITTKNYTNITQSDFREGFISIPNGYKINKISEKDGKVYIDMNLPDTISEKEAIYQINFIMDSIKKLNPDKNMDNIAVKAVSPYGDFWWEYDTNNKSVIISCEKMLSN